MAKHHKSRHLPPNPDELKKRIARTKTEGKFQQGLELARELFKAAPSAEHRQLLKEMSLGRAQQLHQQNANRDALTLLEAARRIEPDNPAWLAQIAELMARCGGIQQAMTLQNQLPAEQTNPKLLIHAADTSLVDPVSRALPVSESFQADHDRIVLAFQQVEAGQDEQALTTLQGIGLRSPFLEWKLLVRGLSLYYQGDDLRAVENWQRLAPDRPPARLAAPFRMQIDAAYRNAQSPETQAVLKRLFDRLQPPSPISELKKLGLGFAQKVPLFTLFRQVESLLPDLMVQYPALVPRLASVFYWAVLDTGPDDIQRYKRIFGSPADDPNFNRLIAMAEEQEGHLDQAHHSWQEYEKDLISRAAGWGPEELQRARALIWLRMAKNAAFFPSAKAYARIPKHIRDLMPPLPPPLQPSADACLQQSLKLAPDLLEAHLALFDYQVKEEQTDRAIRTGKALVQQFPDHVATHERLTDLYLRKEQPDEALASIKEAVRHNPLNRDLRKRLTYVYLACARLRLTAGQIDEARSHYRLALEMETPGERHSIYSKMAACEFKAKNAVAAEELVVQAKAQAPSLLAVSLQLLVEVQRLKLDRKLKTRFEKEFKAGLALPPTAVDAVELLKIVFTHQMAEVDYVGQKTHTKQVLTYVEHARTKVQFTGQQLRLIAEILCQLPSSVRSREGYIRLGRQNRESSPYCILLEVQETLNKRTNRYYSPYHLEHELTTAEHQAQAFPDGPDKTKLLNRIGETKKMLQVANPFAMGFNPFFDDEDDEEDWEDE